MLDNSKPNMPKITFFYFSGLEDVDCSVFYNFQSQGAICYDLALDFYQREAGFSIGAFLNYIARIMKDVDEEDLKMIKHSVFRDLYLYIS